MRPAVRALLLGGQAAAPAGLTVTITGEPLNWVEFGVNDWQSDDFAATVTGNTGATSIAWSIVSGSAEGFNFDVTSPGQTNFVFGYQAVMGTVVIKATATDTVGSAEDTATISN